MQIKSLIDTSYFKFSDRYIPNVNETEYTSMQSNIDHFIQLGEREIEMRAFGLEMYRDFKQYVEVGGLVSNAPQNYKDIVNGKDYIITDSHGNETHKSWSGLIDKELCKDSLIADYVFYQYWQNNVTNTSDMGEVKNVGKVSNIHSMSAKLSGAYNSFLSKFQGGFNRSYYHGCAITPYRVRYNRLKNGVWLDYYSESFNGEVSLLTFLHDMNMIDENNYPLLRNNYLFDSGLKYQNSFGL